MIEVGGFKAADPSPIAAGILPGDPAQPLALRCLHETNRHLPPQQQFDAWREANASFLIHHSPPSRPESYEADEISFWPSVYDHRWLGERPPPARQFP